MGRPGVPPSETYNPWSVVNLVFHHLAEEGLHPVLGERGDPGGPAAEGNRQVSRAVKDELAQLRETFFGER
jgi:hypothetical protein